MSLLKIVLVEPEIPQNTGNIGRTCVALNAELHLIEPLGFELSDRTLKRAGLDYWQHLRWFKYPDYESWWQTVESKERVFFLSTKAQQYYSEIEFQKGDWLVFGKETKGLDPSLLRSNIDRALKIPILGPVRSLNLATSVAVVGYEAIRQIENMK